MRRGWGLGALSCAIGFAWWAFISDSNLVNPAAGAAAGSPLKTAPVGLMLFGWLLTMLEQRPGGWFTRPFRGRFAWRCLAAYLFVTGAVSLLAADPGFALQRTAQMTAAVLAAMVIGYRSPRIPLLLAGLACTAHVVIGALDPQQVNAGFDLERTSGYLQVNTYAFAGSTALVVGLFLLLRRPGRSLVSLALIGLGAWANVGAVSRTSLLAAGAAGVVVLLLRVRYEDDEAAARRPKVLRGFVMLAVPLVALFALAGDEVRQALGVYFARGSEAEIGTLTGRVELWRVLLDYAALRPWGYGAGSLRDGDLATTVIATVGYGGQGHNALIGALVDAGFLGAVLWLGFMLATGVAAWRNRTPVRPLLVGLWLLVAISSVTEAGPQGFGLFWAVTLAVFVYAVKDDSFDPRLLGDPAGVAGAGLLDVERRPRPAVGPVVRGADRR